MKTVPHLAKSPEAFVQYIACNLLPWGYQYVVTGTIRPGQTPERVDHALIEKFDCNKSRGKVAYQKSIGRASIRYVRYDNFWLMLATKNKHFAGDDGQDSFTHQAMSIANGGRIHFRGYSIRLVRDTGMEQRGRKLGYRSHVAIGRTAYRDLLTEFLTISTRQSVESIRRRIYCVPFEPYGPVIQQMRDLLYRVNRKRKSAGLKPIEPDCVRVRRIPVPEIFAQDVSSSQTKITASG